MSVALPAVEAQAVAAAQTMLFVPGVRPDRFGRAVESGCDLVILDLEDAVAEERKAESRGHVARALADGLRAIVRVNPTTSTHFAADMQMVTELGTSSDGGLVGIMLPKAEPDDKLYAIASAMRAQATSIVALVETAAGVTGAGEMAAVPGVDRLAFGALDFALDVDATEASPVMDFARSSVVLASRAAGIAGPLESPCTDIRDVDVVRHSARRARHTGFTGQLCVHPMQVAVVADEFAPTDAELAWARALLAQSGAVFKSDGQMVDRPVLLRAQRLLARAAHHEEAGASPSPNVQQNGMQ